MKRLVMLCDGTLEDADKQKHEGSLTNIGRLSRAIVETDTRSTPPIPQIKLYQSGVGTDETALGGLITGALGRGMMERTRDLYGWLALNWEEGDEIYLFGYSRGAYIARLLACLVDIIGILEPRKHLQLFPRIFAALDAHTGKDDDDDRAATEKIRGLLKPLEGMWKKQRERDGGFLIDCVGAFDTVAARGRPSILRSASYTSRLTASTPPSEAPADLNSFGLPATRVPSCVRTALQALALDERRKDYAPVLWRRWDEGDKVGERAAREREQEGQEVEQVWFAGAHADVGGGYPEADLSFLSLEWLVSRLSNNLAFDDAYLQYIYSRTNAPWGEMAPHQSRVGEFRLAPAMDRALPSFPLNPCTNEFLHASLLAQPESHLRPGLQALMARPHAGSELYAPLGEGETRLLRGWLAPVQRARLGRTKTAPPLLQGGAMAGTGGGTVPGAEDGDSTDGEEGATRPPSVTSFTDNEDAPSPPPSPVAPKTLPAGAFPALGEPLAKHAPSSPALWTPYEALRRGWLRGRAAVLAHEAPKYS
ncbi:hypothetical protein JCM3770_000136 [Rhodotorula araucariae]